MGGKSSFERDIVVLYQGECMKPVVYLLSMVAILLMVSGLLTAQPLEPTRTFDLNAMRGNPFPNALKLFDVAVDNWRGLSYSSPIMTRNYPVIDINAGKEVKTVEAPFTTKFEIVSLDVNPVNGFLIMKPNDLNKRLIILDPKSGNTVSTFDNPAGKPFAGLVVDARENRVFITDGSPLIRVMDGETFTQVDSIVAGIPCGGLAIDSLRQELIVASRQPVGGKTMVRTFSLSDSYRELRSLSYPATEPFGRVYVDDLVTHHLALVGTHKVMLLDDKGILYRTVEIAGGVQDVDICARASTLFIVDGRGFSEEGEHGETGKIHWIDLKSGGQDSLRAGQHVKHFAVYQREAKLVLNSAHSNHVVIIDCFSKAVEARVDVGESAESLALNADGTTLYIADRLGDENGIARVGLSDNRLMMLRSGNWPVMIAYDAGLRALFSIDHLQSSLSVFDEGEVLPSDTIDIPGVPEARTDALSHLYLEPTTHTLLVCIPEAETWALVDGNTRAVTRTGNVDGYTYGDYGGVGYLQGVIAADVENFFILRLAEKMLNIYDLRDGTFLQEVNLKTLPWKRMQNTLGDLLWYDSVDKILYIGPTPFDVRTRRLSSFIMPGSSRIIGRTRDNRYLVGLQVDDSVRVVLHETRNKRIARIASLYPFWYGTPVVLFDRERDRLFTAEFQFAIVREYNLAGITSVRRDQPSPSFELESPYPQPVDRGQVATVDMTLESRGSYEPVALEVLDVLGRSVKVVAAESDGTGFFRVRIPTRDLAPGIYFYRLKAPVHGVVRKLVVR